MLKVSFSVSTNKPHYWQRFCEALSHNNAEIEVIFVGICGEGQTMPVPTKFIHTNVKPAQCWEIGSRFATGDIICFAADDCIFTPGIVDDVVKKVDNTFDMYSGKYYFNGNDYHFAMHMFSDQFMPLLPVGGFTFLESHRKLCGIDRRFHAVAWDSDLYMRFYEAGGRTILLDNHQCHEAGDLSSLFPRNKDNDIPLLNSFWRKDGRLQRKRTCPPIPFDDKDILLINQ